MAHSLIFAHRSQIQLFDALTRLSRRANKISEDDMGEGDIAQAAGAFCSYVPYIWRARTSMLV